MNSSFSIALPYRHWLVAMLLLAATVAGGAQGAEPKSLPSNARIILLHHSTGQCIWNGGLPGRLRAYNAANKTQYSIAEQAFPKESPYGWENYPYDYWNIWVRHAGTKPYKQEPTLEILTRKYNVIVLKHCFPVSNIEADTGRADVASSEKRVENYRLQYAALKKKMREFPAVRFLVWTGPAQVANDVDQASARRARKFFDWVRTKWDEQGDNIYLWDFYALETEGGLYLKPAYASGDAHPNEAFSKKVAPLLCRRIVDVIQGRGDTGNILGGKLAAAPPPATPATPAPPETAPQEPTTAPAPAAKKVAVKPTPTGPGTWVLDNAEDSAAEKRLWGAGAGYAKDGSDNVIGIRFADGREEDWGEYGRQRIVLTRPPAKNHDVSGYRYLAVRVKVDRKMEVVLTLLTLPDPSGPRDQSHFGFTAYLHPPAGAWKTFALDLTKLELSAEGDQAYAKAGKPGRPMHLSALKFVTNKKNEAATVLIDDITFYRDLPKELQGSLQEP